MNHLTQNREWPKLHLSRWQVIQLTMLSALIAGMAFWKFQYEQILPKGIPVQMILKDTGKLNDQSVAKNTSTLPKPAKASF
ncbi:hypothetical protein [Larkinella arboricola]|uniref:Uncharacterized protein n=1 Tax=Larkinella arboricola TaxID=643671 RepID=A0A327WPV9_LARAB|nr:hypothetical protein [Larkinella arboricola]RAJ94398.1 hypothetical protein LX87_04285 [Larkinella arboricola]